MDFNIFSTLLSDPGYAIAICAAIFALVEAIRSRKLGKKPVIITAVCGVVLASLLIVGAKFLPHGDNQTIVPSVTAPASTTMPVSTFATTATAVPSATPGHPKPTTTPTPRLTPTPPGNTPVSTPAICQAPCDAEFPDTGKPFTINGPAIVEWADPGCGIYELNAGKAFTWSSDGHYWLYPDQASLNSNWPGHLNAYQSNPGHSSCKVGPPP